MMQIKSYFVIHIFFVKKNRHMYNDLLQQLQATTYITSYAAIYMQFYIVRVVCYTAIYMQFCMDYNKWQIFKKIFMHSIILQA